MIAETYLKEALHIKKSWDKVLSKIDLNESKLKEVSGKLSDIQNKYNSMLNNEQDMETGSRVILRAFDEMMSVVSIIDAKLEPLRNEERILRQRAEELYEHIRDTYTDMSDEEIQKEVARYVLKYA